ncbi:MIP/aquaporin family protein [Acidilobus sp.]|uniref:MIP/aquaporin family protein n=1 Tax=Acidilobus sp. TaxID=1872109 RepID=UPI003D0580F8
MITALDKYVAEFIGTMLLILFGDGVVANVVLPKTKGNMGWGGGAWITITAGWAWAVAVGVYSVHWISGGYINPAVAIAGAALGTLPWSELLGYIIAEIAGAFVGALLVYVTYHDHYKESVRQGQDPVLRLATFSTVPNIRNYPKNFITEVIGTFALELGVLTMISTSSLGPYASFFGAFLVALLVYGIGLSLGGPTGYAINPARDLGPRIAHAILFHKESSDWHYAWVPIFGPIVGALLAALVYHSFFAMIP